MLLRNNWLALVLSDFDVGWAVGKVTLMCRKGHFNFNMLSCCVISGYMSHTWVKDPQLRTTVLQKRFIRDGTLNPLMVVLKDGCVFYYLSVKLMCLGSLP